MVDSISGLDEPLDLEPPKTTEDEGQKYEDYDEMLEDYEKSKSEPQKDGEKLSQTEQPDKKADHEQ